MNTNIGNKKKKVLHKLYLNYDNINFPSSETQSEIKNIKWGMWGCLLWSLVLQEILKADILLYT